MTEYIGTHSERCLETIEAAHFVRAWKQDFGIDVAALFKDIDQIEMRLSEESGRIRFVPSVPGDPAFYRSLRKFGWYHPEHKLEHAQAAQLAKPASLVLDVGAGTGDFSGYLNGATYLGLESDGAAVETAKALGRDVRQLTLSEWRKQPGFKPADVTAAFQVLEHVTDPEDFIAEMAACLSRHGTLILGVPDAESYVADLPDFMLNAPPHHLTWWSEEAIRQLLNTAGFDVTDILRFPVEPWEYQLWWMAQIARVFRKDQTSRFGQPLRLLKVISFALSWPLQWLRPPRSARGSTLLVTARRASLSR
ncbi:MAG: class I SAM-dependent methyltransferase [Pseudomonadota bacterium]